MFGGAKSYAGDGWGVLCSEVVQPKRLAFEHFSKLATPLDDTSFRSNHFRHVNEYVSSLPFFVPDARFDSRFTRDEFTSIFRKLKNKKATGTDKLPYELFKYGEKPAVYMLLTAGNFY